MSVFKKGELIISSKPYAYVLNNVERGKRCDYCFCVNDALKRCSQCSFAYFCDRQCQSKAWDQHKEECKCIKKVHPKEPTPSLRLITLVILKVKKYGYDEPEEGVGEGHRSFGELESHGEEIKRDLKTCQQMIAFVGTLKDYIGQHNIPPPPEFAELFGKTMINTFSICDPEMQSIGSGLYLGPSILDHSCAPNAEVVFDGTTLNVRAICDIPHRDIRQVFISYIDQMQLREDRQKHLRDQYYFTCKCQRCTDSYLEDLMNKTLVRADEAKQVVETSKSVVRRIRHMKKSNESPSSILEIAMDTLSMQESILSESHICRVKIIEFAFDACIQNQRWVEAIATGLELVGPYKMFFGEYHPNYCVLLLKIGKIQHLLHKNNEAKKHLLKAKESIIVSHGTDHSLYKELTKILTQCQMELDSSS